jgi:hypothetical protein
MYPLNLQHTHRQTSHAELDDSVPLRNSKGVKSELKADNPLESCIKTFTFKSHINIVTLGINPKPQILIS